MDSTTSDLAGPEFLKLLAHELRWQMLRELARSDYRGQELVQRLKLPQNQISYHLRQLITHHLVSERRSSADARDIYYHLNLTQISERYAETASFLHPALGEPIQTGMPVTLTAPVRVLFLCTENSARSQMAEGLLRHLGGGRVEVVSAGSRPTTVHPFAVQVLARRGIDISQATSKHLDSFLDQSFDVVITVCDRMRECCPAFPKDCESIHWSLPDPVALEGLSVSEHVVAFEQLAEELTTRIQHLLALLASEQKKSRKTA